MDRDLTEPAQKRVKFADGTNENKNMYTPLVQSKRHKQDRNTLIKGLWVRLSQSGQYQQLSDTLSNFQLKGQAMVDFFSKEGAFLLRFSLLRSETVDALHFICANVPEDVLRKSLASDHYYALSSFLLGDSGLEESGLIDETMRDNRLEKLKLLVTLDPIGLAEYMESEYFKTHFSEGVKKSFRQALEGHQLARSDMRC